MPLAETRPGRYIVRAKIAISGVTTATLTREIEIVGPDLAQR
jgi:hypothetical protein